MVDFRARPIDPALLQGLIQAKTARASTQGIGGIAGGLAGGIERGLELTQQIGAIKEEKQRKKSLEALVDEITESPELAELGIVSPGMKRAVAQGIAENPAFFLQNLASLRKIELQQAGKESDKDRLARIKKETETRVRATEETKGEIKAEKLGTSIDNFLALDDIIQEARTEKGGFIGEKRLTAAAKIKLEKLRGDSNLGAAASSHDSLSKRLRVQLVRAAGDVGNINIVEQEAAEKIVPQTIDTKKIAMIKRTILRQLKKAIKDRDPNAIRKILDNAGVGFSERKSEESEELNSILFGD